MSAAESSRSAVSPRAAPSTRETASARRTRPRTGWRVFAYVLSALILAATGVGLYSTVKVRDALSSMTQAPLSLIETIRFALGARSEPAYVPPEPSHLPAPFIDIDDALWTQLFDDESVTAAADDEGATPKAKTPTYEDPDRINILLLGMRGAGDDRGGLLSDAILVVSVHQRLGRVAVISVPRDLYVNLPGSDRYHKINAAHAIGQAQDGRGLELAKATVSSAAGIPIHHAVSVNFAAFTEVVDILGGVEVDVQRDFTGTEREGLSVTRGLVHMDGETALTYATSRQTTSDFDRSRRQREVIDAVIARAREQSLDRQPVKLLEILESLGRNVRTTMTANDITALLGLSNQVDLGDLIEMGFDASPSSPLTATRASNGAYILVPRDGTFDELQSAFQGVFDGEAAQN